MPGMGSINYPSFSVLFVATVGLFLAGGAEARFKGINPFCRTSDYRLLCTKMVTGATTQDMATSSAVQATLDVTGRVVPLLDSLGEALSNLPDLSKDAVISTCKDSYGNAVDNLKDALSYLKSGDQYTVIDRIQTAESSFYDCSSAIKEMGGATPLAAASKILYKYASNCMAVVTQM